MMTQTIKKTALFDTHLKCGGKMIDFAGWMLPVQYEGLIPEHEAVRTHAGIFDVSHMGEVEIKGRDATRFIQYLVTNDISTLCDGQIAYTLMCYPHGGVVDDLLVYKHTNTHYLLVLNASNIDKDYAWIVENSIDYIVETINISETISEVALQGPLSETILQQLTATNLSEIKFFFFKNNILIDNIPCLVSRTGYTGEDGFELYFHNEFAPKIWEKLMDAGKIHGLKPAGLGARDTLRFEATLPLYGNEISENISPLEAGLDIFVKLNKENFIGKAALAIQKERGLFRKIVGFEMVDKNIPRHGYEVCYNGRKIGIVTTGYHSPTLKKNIGLALIEESYAKLGNSIEIIIRNKPFEAIITSKKFYNKNYKKS